MFRRKKNKTDGKPAKLNRETLKQATYIFKYIGPYKIYLILGMILLFLSNVVFMVFPYLSGLLIDIAQGNATMNISLKQGAVILGVLLVLQGLISYTRVLCFAQVSERGLANLRKALFDKLLTLPIIFFEGNKSGELISRITGDIEKLYSTFSVTLAEFFRQLTILIIGIAFLLVSTPRLALLMITTFPVIVVGAMFFGKYIRRLSRERQDKMAVSNDVISESTQAITVVKAFTNEVKESLRFGDAMGEVVKTAIRFAKSRALFSAFIVTVLFGALFFIIWSGALMISNGEITAGNLVSFVAYTAIIGGAIAGLGTFYTSLLEALGATERVREILNEKSELEFDVEESHKMELTEASISFENVHFSYPSRPDVEVLKGVQLSIEAGQMVALAGPSGAGKSTIIQLLLRFYSGYTGDILLNGSSILDQPVRAYRSLFALVPQEVILFSGSIKENIIYGDPSADEARVIEAAKRANAWEYIERFPEGLDTIIGEHGVRLSGGQRQRLAIARAILKDPLILILDEATSSLDSESEGLVQQALNNLMEGRTSIVIAHRLSTIKNADKIFVIDAGEIVESGKHEELVNMGGLYSNLIKLQFHGSS
jgi:ABC-type multidrug transport system fused ATPase/permease subunit